MSSKDDSPWPLLLIFLIPIGIFILIAVLIGSALDSALFGPSAKPAVRIRKKLRLPSDDHATAHLGDGEIIEVEALEVVRR
jgi:hypothetical protein